GVAGGDSAAGGGGGTGGGDPRPSSVVHRPSGAACGDSATAGGAVRYEVRVRPSEDAHPENNHAAAWVEVAGGPRVLLVTNYPDDPLAALLGAQGLRVERVTEPAALTAASLAGARLVVLNNVPAHRVPAEFLDALDFFVREQGGGLLMAGGRNSFGSGGWFASAIDALLPVSMELKNDHRRLATAMAIILDRSGSMAMSAGAGWQTKMDLANTGAARAIELLGDLDAVSVHAVDSSAHEIVALAQVGPNRGRMTDAVRRIRSEGGGIFVGAGLRAGWEQLRKARTGQLHLILFADAADAEQPGDYKETIAEMRAAGATVSVIGLGSPADRDAELLREIAALGGGRIFFNENAGDLPAVFAQETVSVARSAFVREETGAAATPGWAEIAARAPRWPPAVDGYNLGYLRPGATASLVTTDEYQAPLVASWSRGAGRVAAVSFPLGGADSARVRGWAGYGDFAQTLARWLAGENTPPGLALRTETRGRLLTLDLFYDESWAARVAQSGPAAVLAGSGAAGVRAAGGDEAGGGAPGGGGRVRALVWEKIEPGHFRAATLLAPDRRVRGAVRLGAAALPFGPVTAGGSAEWSFERERVQELRQLSARSGGMERLDLASVWDAPRPSAARGLRPWLLAAWVALLLTDALLTRLGVRLSFFPARQP
ncbi:MAG: VWA domain-containing protein, partial [Opitutaceae bacterium]|nr:VWA domain-containing protein [Opitutaceae bacterium]